MIWTQVESRGSTRISRIYANVYQIVIFRSDSAKKLLDEHLLPVVKRTLQNPTVSNTSRAFLFDAVPDVLDSLNAFVNTKRGDGDHAAEKTISKAPISAKHNPFCGQSFNGNDRSARSTWRRTRKFQLASGICMTSCTTELLRTSTMQRSKRLNSNIDYMCACK